MVQKYQELEIPMSNEFNEALKKVIEDRMSLIPWHHTNGGVEIQRQHVWKFETMCGLLSPNKSREYLVAYDTLGYMTYCLLQVVPNVDYHSTVDKYDFPVEPKRRWITDIRHLPPKSYQLDKKYDGILLPTLLHEVPLAEAKVTLSYLRSLLKSENSGIVCSYVENRDPASRWSWASAFESVGFKIFARFPEPMDMVSTRNDYFVVSALEVVK